MKLSTILASTALFLTLGCARPEPVSAPPPGASPPPSAWYSPRNWFRRVDYNAQARKPGNDEVPTDTSGELRAK